MDRYPIATTIGFIIASMVCTPAAAQQVRMTGLNLGDLAPEIAMKGPGGDTLRLSQLRGKVVLVDFWASWCRPCRAENPNVVNAWRKYRNLYYKQGNGFEVFSVSLDRAGGKEAWTNAIRQDSLQWNWHVAATEGGENTAAQRYGVQSIPTNVLIDGNGVVIAKDVRGVELYEALNSVVEVDPIRMEMMRRERLQQARDQAQ